MVQISNTPAVCLQDAANPSQEPPFSQHETNSSLELSFSQHEANCSQGPPFSQQSLEPSFSQQSLDLDDLDEQGGSTLGIASNVREELGMSSQSSQDVPQCLSSQPNEDSQASGPDDERCAQITFCCAEVVSDRQGGDCPRDAVAGYSGEDEPPPHVTFLFESQQLPAGPYNVSEKGWRGPSCSSSATIELPVQGANRLGASRLQSVTVRLSELWLRLLARDASELTPHFNLRCSWICQSGTSLSSRPSSSLSMGTTGAGHTWRGTTRTRSLLQWDKPIDLSVLAEMSLATAASRSRGQPSPRRATPV